jgi:hypothetical protein
MSIFQPDLHALHVSRRNYETQAASRAVASGIAPGITARISNEYCWFRRRALHMRRMS